MSEDESVILYVYCLLAKISVVKLLCRANYWYINIYNLWLNTVFNIVLPIASLVILNILILRYVVYNIKYYVQNFLTKHYQCKIVLLSLYFGTSNLF